MFFSLFVFFLVFFWWISDLMWHLFSSFAKTFLLYTSVLSTPSINNVITDGTQKPKIIDHWYLVFLGVQIFRTHFKNRESWLKRRACSVFSIPTKKWETDQLSWNIYQSHFYADYKDKLATRNILDLIISEPDRINLEGISHKILANNLLNFSVHWYKRFWYLF